MEMTSKERFCTALAHNIPDRVPINEFLYSRKVYEEAIGRRPTFYNSEDLFDCAHAIGLDSAVMMFGGFAGMQDTEEERLEYQDEWQITYRKEKDATSWPVDAPVGSPLKNREDWKNYDMPDINKPGRLEQINIAVRKAAEYKMASIGGIRGPFTPTWLIFGFEHFSTLLFEDPTLLDDVLTEITDFYITGARMMVEAGVDAVLFADDYGSSAGPLMSPRHFRKHIWPQLARLVNAVHDAGSPIIMHSDGDIRRLLPDLIPLGMDAWHPLERHANIDIAEVKKTYGQEITLIGNIDNTDLLVNGSVDDVIEATKECLRIAAPGGGYILGSDHSVHEDMPNENIFAMIETGKKYGQYPISID